MRKRSPWLKAVYAYLQVIAGSVITGVALDVFLIPNHIAAGGVSGLAMVTNYLTGLPVGLTMVALEVPLFLACLRTFGAGFGMRSLVGTLALAGTVDLLAGHVTTIPDPMLAVFYGGGLAGLGLGLAFRSGGTTGGTDLAARLIHRFSRMSIGQSLLIVDSVIIAVAGVFFGPVPALYAILVLLITGRVIDFVQEGANYSKGALIISSSPDPIRACILRDMNRGVTILKGMGGFTGEDKEVLFVIVSRPEIVALKQIVRSADARAFVVITDVREVLGEGFIED